MAKLINDGLTKEQRYAANQIKRKKHKYQRQIPIDFVPLMDAYLAKLQKLLKK